MLFYFCKFWLPGLFLIINKWYCIIQNRNILSIMVLNFLNVTVRCLTASYTNSVLNLMQFYILNVVTFCTCTYNALSVLDSPIGWMNVTTSYTIYLVCDSQSAYDKVTYPMCLINALCFYLLIINLFLKLVIMLWCLSIAFCFFLQIFGVLSRFKKTLNIQNIFSM